jgi:hypothetical protein
MSKGAGGFKTLPAGQPTAFMSYGGYSRVARCPGCGFTRAIIAGEREYVECQARSFRQAERLCTVEPEKRNP